MKIIGVISSARPGSISSAAVRAVLEAEAEKGAKTLIYDLNSAELKGCRACLKCKIGKKGCVSNDVLKTYWSNLSDADAVVFGAANYMGNLQAQAWSFMNRHYCLTDNERNLIIPSGKKLVSIVAQGFSEEEHYKKLYSDFFKCFSGWGFDVAETIVLAGKVDEVRIDSAVTQALGLLD